MKKLMLILILLPAGALAALYAMVILKAPRMKVQQHVRAFQLSLPNPPEGTVTVQTPVSLPVAGQGALLKNPLASDDKNRERGEVYYQYYCVFCHGREGAGNGPVGQSYTPVPANLRSARVRGYRDGELLRAMLTGAGHEPVLERVVLPGHRWYLVLYVRSLAGH